MTVASRPTPYALVFGALGPERFPMLRDGLAVAGRDPREQDGFLLVEEVATLLRELAPEEGLGESVAALVGLLHAAYVYWLDGERTVLVSPELLDRALSARPDAGATRPGGPVAHYVQLPPLRVWGVPSEAAPAEPLDGWFAIPKDGRLEVLAVFGLHPGRGGLTAVAVEGPRPGFLEREDGSPLFAPTLPGGEAAGLASVIGQEEVLELAWRLEGFQ